MYYRAQTVFAPDDLEHYGVLGMHWGVRKEQERAGSKPVRAMQALGNRIKTSAQTFKSYAKSIKNSHNQYRKNLKTYRNRGDMSDDELFMHVRRIQLENQLKNAVYSQRNETAQLAKKTVLNAVIPAAISATLMGGVTTAKVGRELARGVSNLKKQGSDNSQIAEYKKQYITETGAKMIEDQVFKAIEKRILK